MRALNLNEIDVPAYWFHVLARPSLSGKGRAAYVTAIRAAAEAEIATPITTPDVQIDIFCASQAPDAMADVDNAAKPALDALKGVAYVDDKQVCGLRVVRIDRTRNLTITGRAAWVAFLVTRGPEAVWINVYSHSRVAERGGYAAITAAFGGGWNGVTLKLIPKPEDLGHS